jgi:RNA polymerase-binding transcription factor DksA
MLGRFGVMEKDEIRQALAAEAARLAAIRDDTRTASELDVDQQSESGGEISVADQHPADVATETQYREQSLSLIEQVEAELLDVERALQKLSDGSYGKCDVCGERIGDERQKELPATALCIDHARQRDEVGARSRDA